MAVLQHVSCRNYCYRIIGYCITGYFRVTKFSRFCLKNLGIIFRGQQHLQKIILILFRKNCRVGGTTWLSLNRSTVQKENLQPKCLKRNGIKDTCSLTEKQKKKSIFTFRRLNKMTVQNRTMKCLSCLLITLCHTTLFAIKQLVVYSECNINANILINEETKTITCMSDTTTKEN